jgi:hypothetical protein
MASPDPTLRPDRRPEDADRPRCARRRWTSSSASTRRGPTCASSSSRADARRGDGPHAVLRPAGAGQDDAGADHGARTGGGVPHDLGAGAGAGGRSGGDPDQSRGARRPVHRRDPPAQPGGRGGALSGDGGFPARSGDRRGAGRAHRADRVAALHAGRRDHAAGPADHAAARPLRHPHAAAILHRGGTVRDRQPRRAAAGGRGRARGRAEIARRARGTPRIAGRLLRRVVDFALVEGDGR